MKKMKKLLAGLMATTMIMSMSIPAFAQGTVEDPTDSPVQSYTAVTKTYSVTNIENGSTSIVPTETLRFTVTPEKTGYPEVTVDPLVLTEESATVNKLTINIPSYSEVGTYHYTITENKGSAQGVTYSTGAINLSVLIKYADDAHTKLEAVVGITNAASEGEAESKIKDLVNEYKLGSLEVSKSVTGTLGNKNKYFAVDVTFKSTSEKTVESAIEITGGSSTDNATSIAEGWTGTTTETIYLKDGETVHFNNIPDGVTYTVVEKNYTDGDKNSENGYDDPVYKLNGTTVGNVEDSIEATVKDSVSITNNKDAVVDTGISLDNMPYIMVLALVALGLVGFVSKKRSMEF